MSDTKNPESQPTEDDDIEVLDGQKPNGGR